MKIKNVMIMALVALSMVFVGCDKNDDVKPKETVKKTKKIDATDWTMWTYINLETGDTVRRRDFSEWHVKQKGKLLETIPAQGSEADIKIKWHIAIHRNDIRTNNGEAIATKEKEISKVTALPTGEYKEDIEVKDKVKVGFNMADMMRSKFTYAGTAKINPVLAKCITSSATHGQYDVSNLVYVVKFKDGSYAKLKFTDFTNDLGKPGFVTFDYEFQPK